MSNKIIRLMAVITSFHDRKVLAILRDGIIEDLILDECTSTHNVGDIVICKVTDILKNISSAFVDLGGEKAFLPLSVGSSVKPGDEIPVQVKKEAAGGKDMSVSSTLSIPGSLCVLSYHSQSGGHVSVSRKIRDEAFREMVTRELSGISDSFDITVRTGAYDSDIEDIKAEAVSLSDKLQEILDTAANRTVFSTLYKAGDIFLRSIRDCRFGKIENITTDIPEEYERLKEAFPGIDMRLYSDDMLPLIKLHKIESTLLSAFERVVWLKSGAYLVVDHTEAMTVIDVNSGKNELKQNREETFLRINEEAAREIARVLRIRNISGMIMVDYINMQKKESREKLADTMHKAFEYDPSNASFIDYTKLGLAEITRKKERPMLRESLRNMESRLHVSLYKK